jgi:hypothetical protein
MSKKLSISEINVLSNVIREKINESKYEKIKSKLEKDVDFKKLEKINKEISELNKKVSEKNKLYNEIIVKVRNKFDINNIMKNGNEVKVYFNDYSKDYNKIYNDIILMNISKEFNVDEMVNRIVEKYS